MLSLNLFEFRLPLQIINKEAVVDEIELTQLGPHNTVEDMRGYLTDIFTASRNLSFSIVVRRDQKPTFVLIEDEASTQLKDGILFGAYVEDEHQYDGVPALDVRDSPTTTAHAAPQQRSELSCSLLRTSYLQLILQTDVIITSQSDLVDEGGNDCWVDDSLSPIGLSKYAAALKTYRPPNMGAVKPRIDAKEPVAPISSPILYYFSGEEHSHDSILSHARCDYMLSMS